MFSNSLAVWVERSLYPSTSIGATLQQIIQLLVFYLQDADD
ncbi:MAG: hypothetical protein VKL59_14750 [Nostocaceae cyanobacterium]|nr:hypothetical protein [Nostocaceae cyanobacterium]